MKHPFSVTGTFICAVIWGTMTMLIPLLEVRHERAEYVRGEIAAASPTMISGAIVVALGFGVFWKKPWAAWLLFGYALFDIISGAASHDSGYLIPLILLVFALFAAISLKSIGQPPAPSE